MMNDHFAAPSHDDRSKCRTCGKSIFIPDSRRPCTFKHGTGRKLNLTAEQRLNRRRKALSNRHAAKKTS